MKATTAKVPGASSSLGTPTSPSAAKRKVDKTATAKPHLTPKLRFPEFRDAGEWSVKTLANTCGMRAGQFVRASEIKEQPASGYFPCFGGNGLRGYTSTHTHEGVYPLVGRQGALCGNVKLCTGKFHATEHAVVARPKKGIAVGWLYYALDLLNLNRFATGQAQPGLSVDVLEKVALAIPVQESEQQKIASCLSSLDDLIGAENQKLDTLKTHKKVLMQQLFPRVEGASSSRSGMREQDAPATVETRPRLRFPEFRDAGEWEVKRLEDLAKRGSGHTPSKTNPEYYNGGIKWVSLADSKRLDCGLISDTAIEISEKGIENSSAVLHPAGTVLISRDAGIGKSAVTSLPMAVSQHFIAWTCRTRLLSNWFLYHLLQNSKPLFERAATGSTIKTIGLQFFIDLIFRVPSLPEQHRIATCLSSLDDRIAAQADKIETLKTHKKGLMQQLFPTPAEVGA